MKKIISGQYQEIVDNAALKAAGLYVPAEGWIRTMRTALGMSGAQLARRLNFTRGAISDAEKNERSGAITLRTLENMAAAMNSRLVYTFVPEKSIKDVKSARAKEKAEQIVSKADTHMALESQELAKGQRQYEIERIGQELLQTMPSDFWDDN